MYCHCGCGGLAPLATITSTRHGVRKGDPLRYIAGHHLKELHARLRRPPNERQCACGCEQPVNGANRQARFVAGHQLAIARSARRREPAESPLACACGCGELTRVAQGHANRYINGHNSRGMKRGPGRYTNAQGYVLLRMPDHPRANKGYVLEHRWVMEQTLGRPLGADEHVHHLNHHRADNRPGNLAVLDPVAHAKYHTALPRRRQTPEQREASRFSMTRVWAERRGGASPRVRLRS